jgi:hypothetical protein
VVAGQGKERLAIEILENFGHQLEISNQNFQLLLASRIDHYNFLSSKTQNYFLSFEPSLGTINTKLENFGLSFESGGSHSPISGPKIS